MNVEQPLSSNLCTSNMNPPSLWRVRILAFLMFAGWIAMLGRLIHIQGSQRELMNHRVARQSTFREVIPARPGEILDRNGYVLAMTVTRDSLYAIPDAIEEPWDFAWKVSSVLDVNADELYKRLTENSDKQFLWIRRRITDQQLQAFQQLDFPRRTWGIRREYLRQYPQGASAAHVLGVRDIDNVGRGGLEESLQQVIRGEDGTRVMTRDARGIVIEVAAERSQAPQHGRSIMTTIDLLTQIETERQMDQLVQDWKPKGACAIVIRPEDGQVFAMVSRPAFDPNLLRDVAPEAWKNLAVSAVFEPGSTFKPFVTGWALQHDMIQKDEVINCAWGRYRMGKRTLNDHHAYGDLNIEDILVKSSNIGMARIAERMKLQGLYEATVSFGFGRTTGIELPGELPGILRPLSRWDDYSLGSVPMGQELAVTPLQLITAHAALANGGRLVRPHLLTDVSNSGVIASPDARDYSSAVFNSGSASRVESDLLDGSVCDWLVQGPMRQVVERGTGKTARIKGLSVFGKTGTAQKLDPQTGTYSDSAWVLSFVCGAPAENPQALVLVMVDEPTVPGSHYGGTIAAPTASAILRFAVDRMNRLSPAESSPQSADSGRSSLRE
ncbi:MAG: penicillin-binding protein 2 [Planctomyces sp.]|nr:penicillin-binding protein 2 [Planctomyces sp.]